MNCPGIPAADIVQLVNTSPELFYTIEALMHPAFFALASRPEERWDAVIAFQGKAQWENRLDGLALPFCSPAGVVQGLIDLVTAFMISPGASDKLKETGLHVYQAGIGLQQAFVFVFLAILIGFHTSMSSLERSGWRDNHNRKWGLMVCTLYFVLTLITVRL